MKIEFQNSFVRWSFLCRVTDIKIPDDICNIHDMHNIHK